MRNFLTKKQSPRNDNAVVDMESKNHSKLFTLSLNRVRQQRTLIFGTCATVFVAVVSVLIFYGCKKDSLTFSDNRLMMSTHSGGMRFFASVKELFEEIERISDMEEADLEAYEKSIGFESFGRKSESIYWQILHELGEPFGVEYFGDEKMNDMEARFTAEDALVYVSKYPEYLEVLKSTISEEGQKTYDIDEFLPKYYHSLFRYVMNDNRMFQVGELYCRVFDDVVLAAHKMECLLSITEAELPFILKRIEEDIEAGNEGESEPMMFGTGKNGTDVITGGGTDGKGIEVPNGQTANTPGCSGREYGTLERYRIENVASPIASNNQERVIADFYCFSNRLFVPVAWETYAYYKIHAEWKSKYSKNAWISCRRHLNASLCMEIWHETATPIGDAIESINKDYKSPKREKEKVVNLLIRNLEFEEQYVYPPSYPSPPNAKPIPINKRPSIYNLTGTIWIGAVSRTFNFGNDIPVRIGR